MTMDVPGMRAAQSNQPASFMERGVSVPFTTPMLARTRLRLLPSGRAGGYAAPELVILNPSGGRGHYIVNWDSVQQLARPTVHDLRLYDVILTAADVSPHGVRVAAQAVAAQGYAGRAARAAACDAVAADAAARTGCTFDLLRRLVWQEEVPQPGAPAPERETLAALHVRARAVIAGLAPRIGVRPPAIAAALETLATALVRTGLTASPRPDAAAPIPALVAQLHALQAEADGWAARQPATKGAEAAMVGTVARVTAVAAECVMDSLSQALGRLRDLIVRAAQEPAAVSAECARLDALLDGWAPLCALHRGADPDHAAIIFQEIAAHAPMIPAEAVAWVGMEQEIGGVARLRRTLAATVPPAAAQWSLDTIARNEGLRAACLSGGPGSGPRAVAPPAMTGLATADPAAPPLAAAESLRLRKVVAMVDGMSDRGQAEAILSPLRDKIAVLRPERVIRFPRLLFIPWDGLITAPAKWRPTDLTIPRTVLAPIIAEVRARCAAVTAEVDAALTARQGPAALMRAGRLLWPAAAAALATVTVPRTWAETALPAHAYPAIGRAVALVFRLAPAIMTIAEHARAGADIGPELLKLLEPVTPAESPLIIAVLMCQLPAPEPLLRVIGSVAAPSAPSEAPKLDPAIARARREGAELATDTLLAQLERQAAAGMLAPDATLAPEIMRIAHILAGIEDGGHAERKRRAQTLRRAFAAVCQKRFAADLTDSLLRPAAALASWDTVAAVPDLEEAARRLRHFEAAARKLGNEAAYHAGLADAAMVFAGMADCAAMDLVDRVRMVEILAGSDRAMALLQPARR